MKTVNNYDYDYDPCEECRINGDDYYYDEDGDLMMNCYDCPLWDYEMRTE